MVDGICSKFQFHSVRQIKEDKEIFTSNQKEMKLNL